MKSGDFGNFTNTLLLAGISDCRYPVKGCHIWLPYGFSYKENVFAMVETYVERAEYGKYQFPRLIPGRSIEVVTRNIDNFEPHLFWLRSGDGTPLNLFLNPTGECGVYTMFGTWIRQESDLPLRIYQRNSTFRPHKRPDAMLNGDELTDLMEGHSAFATSGEATAEFERMVEVFRQIHDNMGIPYLPLRRPIQGNKPVCIDMVSFETYLPSKNRSFNVGVLYNQDQIYSRAFGVEFSRTDGRRDNTHQVTFGISERGIAAMLDLHRDENGLRLLPEFAPEQILIIPVYGEDNGYVRMYAERLREDLGRNHRVRVDDRESPQAGKKLAAARLRGVPVRIGVSSDNVGDNSVRVYLRTQDDPLDRFPAERLSAEIPDFFRSIEIKIKHDASAYLQAHVKNAGSREEIREIVEGNKIARFAWCDDNACTTDIDQDVLGEFLGSHLYESVDSSCVSCGKDATISGYYSKRSSSP